MLRKTALTLALACALPALAAEDTLLVEARSVATAIPPKLLEVLAEEIAKGGPENAIGVCREKAPAMAKAASEKSGWAIRRVSLKNRNAKAVPDAWEKAVLEDFDRRVAAGEKPATLEKGEAVTVDGKPMYRYMKALPTQELCVQCHGTSDKVSPAVQARLRELYPDDKATGFNVGAIRGAITIKKPL
ncbi:MAG: DUF3365 domain-containing protein [Rhodocyclales bacterium]|nr:DUF3365 domain-containing protein [Rhodocyclales bacterium]